ncbi:WD domain-containing protein [Xylariales sp. PMI_506]|nr:WD domain-containing protein [Xylariales sp. PMI_506]
MTEGSPRSSDDETRSSSGPELAEIAPQPEADSPELSGSTDGAEQDGGEGDLVVEASGDGHGRAGANDDDEDEEDDDEEEEEETDDEDDEPRLKYARLTQHLSAVYRNGDMTSAFLVSGDKMVVGTHNGNIHVVQLPIFQSLRFYHAHSTSVTNISISPFPSPLLPTSIKPDVAARVVSSSTPPQSSRQSEQAMSLAPGPRQRKPAERQQLPDIPSNKIYVATSSMDGHVCVQSLMDMRDVSLRNFARPVQAVALSPEFKSDRTYLSGGTAGNLVLTVNAPQGRSTSTTVGTAAATASGWLGSMGLGANTGRDTVLHTGEGTISTIKWSLSGKYVVWLNEHGIKIMRSNLRLESADAEDAWKRIGHIDRPQTDEWQEMAGVWKGRAEWIDEQAIETDDDQAPPAPELSPAAAKLRETSTKNEKKIERLLVGWGGTIWIIHVHPGGIGVGKHAGEKTIGKAEIAKKLRMDCIISGISLYTQNLLLVLAYCQPDSNDTDEEDNVAKRHKSVSSTTSASSEPSGGRRRRQNALAPELRLIDLTSQAEVDKDSLTVSRFERLSSNDYHLGVLPAKNAASVVASRGVLETMAGLGNEMWNAAINPKSIFNSGASVRSKDSNDGASSHKVGSTAGSVRAPPRSSPETVHPNLVKPGAKIFIHSPFDCILATKRDLGDHLAWLLEHQSYEDAWSLLDEHPEILVTASERYADLLPPLTPSKTQQSSDDFYEDTASILDPQNRSLYSSAEKEKRRIGDLWIQELVDAGDWHRAGQVASKVLTTSERWEKWVYTFAGAKKFDEIVDCVPSEAMRPPIPGTVYEILLGHYIQTNKLRFEELLDRWGVELFDIHTIITALENQLKFGDVREDSIEDGERGRDWRIVMEALATLYESNGKFRDALKCFIKLQDADAAMRLIRDNHLADAVTDDVPSFIALRVPESQLDKMSIEELDEATSEGITLLVEEAQRGLIKTDIVVRQLEKKDFNLYLYFYLRGLWNVYRQHHVDETICLVDDFADLAVQLFASYDRALLMDFLKISTSYTFEKAVQECESHNYVPELVYLYSMTGQMKRALYLIIDRLGDVSQAIAFAKEQDDPDLWDDLLNYSMDKPRFIRGLLEEVGTAINPITLVRRIPEGLEIPGLREGLKHIMKEHEIQFSLSSGVARVLRSEVSNAQNMLRMGQRKGIKFEVTVKAQDHVDIEVKEVPNLNAAATGSGTGTPENVDLAAKTTILGGITAQQPDHDHRDPQPGHCASCHEPFTVWEAETLVGFACGHVFHVGHLLRVLHPGEEPDPSIVEYGSGSEDRTRGGRFVGSKATHARLLRDKIEAGCPVCRYRREVVEGSS